MAKLLKGRVSILDSYSIEPNFPHIFRSESRSCWASQTLLYDPYPRLNISMMRLIHRGEILSIWVLSNLLAASLIKIETGQKFKPMGQVNVSLQIIVPSCSSSYSVTVFGLASFRWLVNPI